jgi:pyridoxine 5-phosphate synthase
MKIETALSVNINKIATIRNARGGHLPDPVEAARVVENAGAHGITVHPRPDERHITREDVKRLSSSVTTEFNIEGYPSREFVDLVLQVQPHQVTLVPDPPDVLTSNNGWDCREHHAFLKEVVSEFKQKDIRTSIFLNPDPEQVPFAVKTGTDRIELYTESFASAFGSNPTNAVKPFTETAEKANEMGLGINAGHDLNLGNLAFFVRNVPGVLEVSIGHALVSDALYMGLNNAVRRYLLQLKNYDE